MSKHISRGLTTALIVTLLMVFTAVPVLAFDARSGARIAVTSGEIVDDDLYVAADAVTIDGTIDGDLWAAASMVTVNGAVTGSVMAAAETVNIGGEVDHAVRAVGQTLSISGNVNGDLMVAGSEVNIASTATIKGDLLLAAGNIRIDGLIEGDVKGYGGEVAIGNGIKGNVDLKVEGLAILPTANIQGDLTYTSEEEADIQSGAQIAGTTTHNLPPAKEELDKALPPFGTFRIVVKVIRFLMALLAGLVIILIAQRRLTSIAESIRSRPGASAGWGALIVFVVPIAAVLVCFTVVGIPVGLIALGLWGMALYLAQIPVGLFIGRCIIGRFKVVEGKAIMVGALALGLVLLKLLELLLGLIPLPGLGLFIVLAVVDLFGVGAVVVAERKRRAEAREVVSD